MLPQRLHISFIIIFNNIITIGCLKLTPKATYKMLNKGYFFVAPKVAKSGLFMIQECQVECIFTVKSLLQAQSTFYCTEICEKVQMTHLFML